MIVYLDTSAIARFYLPEAHRDEMKRFLAGASALTTHSFTQVEIASALAKAHRDHRISDEDLKTARDQFARDWPQFDRVMPDDATAFDAARLIERFVLRAMDALHVTAAERVRRAIAPRAFAFLSFDGQQNEAARALGMTIPDLASQGSEPGHDRGPP